MVTDRFILKDEEGNILAEKAMVEHLKVLLDDMRPEPGRRFVIKSKVTGYVFEISETTTAEDWREFSDKCLMALDYELVWMIQNGAFFGLLTVNCLYVSTMMLLRRGWQSQETITTTGYCGSM